MYISKLISTVINHFRLAMVGMVITHTRHTRGKIERMVQEKAMQRFMEIKVLSEQNKVERNNVFEQKKIKSTKGVLTFGLLRNR